MGTCCHKNLIQEHHHHIKDQHPANFQDFYIRLKTKPNQPNPSNPPNSKSTPAHSRQIYQQILQQYSLHQIDQAYKSCLEFQSLIQIWEDDEVKERWDYIQQIKIIATIKAEMQDIMQLEKEIYEGRPFQEKSNKDNLKISVRREEDHTISGLIESYIDIPISAPLAIITETELYNEVLPFAEQSSLEKIHARNCRLSWAITNLPFLSYREIYFRYLFYDRLKSNGEILFYCNSIHNRKDLQTLYNFQAQIQPDNIPFDCRYIMARYRPIKQNYGYLQIALNADPKVTFVPDFILEFIIEKFAVMLFENIINLSKKYEGSKWEEQVAKHPELFNHIEKVVKDFFISK